MKGYEPVLSFDEANASVYDELAVRGDEEQTVDVLAELATEDGRGGRALELAIGTGRIALPLSARGVAVDGIDLSPPMVERLRQKPGGTDLHVVIGDIVDTTIGGGEGYDLVYVVFNSFFNILSQDDQVRCFQNVAAEAIEVDAVRFDLLRLDPASQILEENHVRITAGGATFNPVMQRYAWPSELDLMARIAGLQLHDRWGGWHRQRFDGNSDNIVSVYGFPR